MCVCEVPTVMSRPRPGTNKLRHQDCYESSSPGSSGPSSPVLATRRAATRARAASTAPPSPSPVIARLMNGVRATRQLRTRVGSSGSGADSPRSLDTPRSALRSTSALSSPLRSSRQGTSSPGEDLSEDSGIRVQRGTYQSMYQDVINIKALLLKLTRVLQENESENSHETTQKNGFCSPSGDSAADRRSDLYLHEKLADLERQVVFLQSQKEEMERTIRRLEAAQPPPPETRGQVQTCNAATQTERVRPLSTGPILSTQPDSAGGSFVSNSSDSVRTQIPNTRPISRLPQWRRSASPSCDLQKPTNKKT